MFARGKGVQVLGLESILGRWLWCTVVLAAPCALGGCNSGGGSPSGESRAEPKSVLPPVGFSATADGFTVKLSWSAASGSAPIVGYEIQRNGKTFASSSATGTSATDDDVRPGKQYRYEIRAKGKTTSSDWVADEVKIKVPPLREARVEGDFGITSHEVSHYGYSTYETPSFGWEFKPKCRHGACDVAWHDVGLKSIHALVDEKHGRYHGTYHGYFLSSCNGTHSVSDVDLSFKVIKARAIAGEWRATKLEGTVENTEASQFGCVSGHAEVAFKGTLRLAG